VLYPSGRGAPQSEHVPRPNKFSHPHSVRPSSIPATLTWQIHGSAFSSRFPFFLPSLVKTTFFSDIEQTIPFDINQA